MQRFATVVIIFVVATSALRAAVNQSREPAATDRQKRARHAVERLTFGPRPGDVEAVAALGVDRWIDWQLHPGGIDDSAIELRLTSYRTLNMSTRDLVLDFPPYPLLKAAMDGKLPMPGNPYRHAVYSAGIARLQMQEEEKKAVAAALVQTPTNLPTAPVEVHSPGLDKTSSASPDANQTQKKDDRHEVHTAVEDLIPLAPEARMQRILSLPAREQAVLLKGLPGAKKQALLAGLSPEQRDTVIALDNPQALVNYELQSAKLLRAVYSERQLEEVLTDFWFNHFNVFIDKGSERCMLTAYERDAIRPHALGKFKDLLLATATSPAMLFYLDNWESAGPDSPAATGHPGRREGLNENYARELMELHTLGVNGGYTQQDVTQVARVFTGWTLEELPNGGNFVFKPRLHEPGAKTVLGKTINGSGEQEGLDVLDLLAHHPSTSHFISWKLAQRFVSDQPPPALVDRMAKTFLKTDGDLREVMKTMFRSRQFWAREAYGAKVKTPLEYVASSIRATRTEITETQPLLNTLNNMGMGLYRMQPPTGYSTNADIWLNSAALLDRLNFALSLANNRIGGTNFEVARLLPGTTDGHDDPHQTQVKLEQVLLAGGVSPQTHQTIERDLQTPAAAGATHVVPWSASSVAALLLASPEFQRR